MIKKLKNYMRYSKWIDEYAKANYQMFSGNVLEAFQPLDFYHFYPLWHDLWLDKIYEGIKRVNLKKLSLEKLVGVFPPPSSVRAFFLKIIATYPHLKNYSEDKFVVIVNFLLNVLRIQCRKDIFALNSNIRHSDEEITRIISEIKLQEPSDIISHDLPRLMFALGNLVNGLYNDVVTDMGWEVYGPYNVSKIFGPKTILVIRDFPNMKPIELWPEIQDYKYKKIRIYNVYRNVKFKIAYVGCHTVSKGDLTKNMVLCSLIVDGKNIDDAKKIEELKDYYLKLATEQYLRVKELKLNFEKLKEKVLLQEHYQVHEFFEFLGMDWRPTKEIIARIKNKELCRGLYTCGRLPSFKEYCKEFGINNLKKIFSKYGEK